MIHFARENLDSFLTESYALMIENNNEINLFGSVLQPDFDSYYNLEKNDSLICFTARSDERIIGYAIFMIYNHMHHLSIKVAHQDMIYVAPKYRVSGIKFIRYTEKALKEIGVNVILQAAPKISRLGGVLTRLGYIEMETIYTRKL